MLPFLVHQTNLAAIPNDRWRRKTVLRVNDTPWWTKKKEFLNKCRYYVQLMDQVSFDVLAPAVADAILRHRLVCHDIFYEIFHASPYIYGCWNSIWTITTTIRKQSLVVHYISKFERLDHRTWSIQGPLPHYETSFRMACKQVEICP